VSATASNTVTLAGEITAIDPLRHTPAGLPVVNFKLTHRSLQLEANIERQSGFEIGAVAIGDIAAAAARFHTGDTVTVQGFLAAKRSLSKQAGAPLILHITHIDQQT
jgi:primosomal replication protein N